MSSPFDPVVYRVAELRAAAVAGGTRDVLVAQRRLGGELTLQVAAESDGDRVDVVECNVPIAYCVPLPQNSSHWTVYNLLEATQATVTNPVAYCRDCLDTITALPVARRRL